MIELKNITKQYVAGDNKVEALRGISIAFRPCEFVSILGPSGGGKTTLLNIIGGLDHYTSGDLIINGTSTSNFNDRQWDSYRNHTVGFVFQTYNLIPHQTVLANVELALTLSGVSRSQRRVKAEEALKAVGLGDQLKKNPNQLSGGQMQRVAIARALVNDPDVILADEPTGALDSQTSIQVMDILKEVATKRLVIMVTHNPDLAKQYSTRIVNLHDGRLTGDSNPYQEQETNDANAENEKLANKPSMSVGTAFGLSLNNLMTKRGRTILTALAGSIGIIGIALIMALSNGVNKYIEDVETETLSSYPLIINISSIDLTTMMTSTMTGGGNVGDIEIKDGVLTEKKIIGDMFASVASNDLKEFKEYLEANDEVVQKDTLAIQYGYGITPQIYKADTSAGAVRLNPSTAFSSITSLMGSNAFSYSSLYQEMLDNQDMLNEQYRVIAGSWPKQYNEVVLILNHEGIIPDLVEYMIGLKDQDELAKMMKAAQNGGTYEVPNANVTKTYTYEDILNLEFKMIYTPDSYQYNTEYGVWEDMTDDESFLKKQVDNGVTLKVVGIIVPDSTTSVSSLSAGIGYTKALTESIINYANNAKITKEQLANKKINVFNGLSFDETKGAQNAKDIINIEDFYSVDKDKLASAFGSKVTANQISTLVGNYITSALGNINIDTTATQTELETLSKNTLKGFFAQLLNGASSITIDPTTTVGQLDTYLNTAAVQIPILNLIKAYNIPEAAQPTMAAGLTNVIKSAGAGLILSTPLTSVDSTTIDGIVDAYFTASQAAMSPVYEALAKQLVEAKIKIAVSTTMGNMAGDLSKTIGGGMTIDAKAFQDAITINMDEDTLTRVITSFVNAGSDATYTDNLTTLGYAEADRPTLINIYLKDFATKEDFMDFVDAYNDNMEKAGTPEKAIKYSDIAGTIISSVKIIVDVVSYVLIAFVAISLIVSSIMIGIITYISVLERTKEIGLLRAMGASKQDVSNVFNAETFIEGLISGVLGVVISMLLCIPISLIVRHVTGINSLTASLPLKNAAFLVLISVILTLIAGLIPSRMAAKKDPVTALRSE